MVCTDKEKKNVSFTHTPTVYPSGPRRNGFLSITQTAMGRSIPSSSNLINRRSAGCPRKYRKHACVRQKKRCLGEKRGEDVGEEANRRTGRRSRKTKEGRRTNDEAPRCEGRLRRRERRRGEKRKGRRRVSLSLFLSCEKRKKSVHGDGQRARAELWPFVRCRPCSLPVFGFSFSHPWGPTTSWGCSVGETHARGSKR